MRQGCPLAPLLYLFVGQALLCLLKARGIGAPVADSTVAARSSQAVVKFNSQSASGYVSRRTRATRRARRTNVVDGASVRCRPDTGERVARERADADTMPGYVAGARDACPRHALGGERGSQGTTRAESGLLHRGD